MKGIGLFFVFFVLFSSCNRNSLEKQLANFIGKEIFFPENLQANLKGRDTLIHLTNAPMKMVVWYDSVGCTACRMQHIYEWGEIIHYVNDIRDVFDLVFIFSPKSSDLHNVKIDLRTSGFKYPAYIDKENLFRKKNPGIPADERLHTFLLDENNKVILVGSPLRNKALWELYKEQIEAKVPSF